MPYLLIKWFYWYIRQKKTNEKPYNEVFPNIFIGKYPYFYPKKFPKDIDVVVDLTNEFSEPIDLVKNVEYFLYIF